MALYEPFLTYLGSVLSIITWRDVIEVVFFSTLFYGITSWLRRDTQKNLVGLFYGYTLLFLVSYTLELTTITTFLFFYTPSIVMLFFMMHQRTLQKNMIGMLSASHKQPISHEWIDELVQAHLNAINEMKEMVCIIERTTALKDFIETPLALNMPLSTTNLRTLVESDLFEQKKFLWINKHGVIQGINASFNSSVIKDWLLSPTQDSSSPTWIYDAQIITNNIDALIITGNPATRKFTIIIVGKTLSELQADSAHHLLKQYFTPAIKQQFFKQGAPSHGVQTDNSSDHHQPSA